MRSVSFFSFSMSYCSTFTCLRISSQASCGMIFNRAWARARPASKSRYFWMRLPSDQTCRMASVPKMSLKIMESIVPVGMAEPFATWRDGASLLRLDAGLCHKCAPLRGFGGDARGQRLRRAGIGLETLLVQVRDDVLLVQNLIHGPVELAYDRIGRAGRRDIGDPERHVVVLDAGFHHGWDIRQRRNALGARRRQSPE